MSFKVGVKEPMGYIFALVFVFLKKFIEFTNPVKSMLNVNNNVKLAFSY